MRRRCSALFCAGALLCLLIWEPPDVGLAPTGVWRVPPHPPLQLEDPSLKPKPFPPRPLPSFFPPPPWLFLQCSGSPARGVPGPPAVLGARPTSGGTRLMLFCAPLRLSASDCTQNDRVWELQNDLERQYAK